MVPAFPGEVEKWQFIQAAGDLDARDPCVKNAARSLLEVSRGRQAWFARLAFCLVRDCIPYQTDTARVGGEHFQPAGKIGELLASATHADDCDSKVRLFVALCRAGGLRAEPEPHWRHGEGGWRLAHVSAVVWVDGKTFEVETTLSRARIGETHEQVPKEQDGKWKT